MNNDWLDIAVLEDYLDGKLDAQAMHRVEREALEDPFVAEALEGLRTAPKRKQTLSTLQKRLQDRVKSQPLKRKIWGITTHRLSIAATATVAFIAVSILFIMRETNRRNQLAKQNHKEVILTLDSNNAVAKQKKITETPSKQVEIADPAVIVRDAPILARSSSRKADKEDTTKNTEKINSEVAAVISQIPQIASAAPQKTNEIRSVVENSASNLGVSKRTNEVITGKVVAKDDGLPLPGVMVKLEGSNVSTTTDKNGHFTLVADSTKNNNLLASYIGYKSKTIIRSLVSNLQKSKAIDTNFAAKAMVMKSNLVADNSFNISLEPDNQALNEVVVRGLSRVGKRQAVAISSTTAANTIMANKSLPIDGWIKWRDYLQKNNRIVKTGTKQQEVLLGFRVSNQGVPIYIKVINGIGNKENAEAIRLLKDGPLWKPVDDEVQITIDF